MIIKYKIPHSMLIFYCGWFSILINIFIFSLAPGVNVKYLRDGRFQIICKNGGIMQVSYFLPFTNSVLFEDKIFTMPVISNPDKMVLYICDKLKGDIQKKEGVPEIDKKINEMKKFKIVIDPGHGGKFVGTMGSVLVEKDLNLDISIRLYELLKSKYEVVLTRNSDRELKDSLTEDLNERVNIGHRIWADLFISIHHNFAYNSNVRGFEIYLPTYSNWVEKENKINALSGILTKNGYNNATSYYNYLKKATNTIAGIIVKKVYNILPVNGIKNKDLRVLRENLIPAILLEIEYLSNPQAENFLSNSYNRQRVAQMLAESIDEYFDNINKIK